MREDGRRENELRPVSLERGFIKGASGSVLVSFGDTRVICTATFEAKVPPWMRNKGKGWVTAEYAMLPGSSHERISRDASKKGRAQEISRLIGRSLRAVTDMEAMGECQVILDCDVIQADGGTRTASITGAYVALYDALRGAVDAGNLDRVPLHSPCAAVSVGLVNGVAMLDLCYGEDLNAGVDLNVVMDDEGRFIEVQGCAEGAPFPRTALNEMLDLAAGGITELISLQKEALEIA